MTIACLLCLLAGCQPKPSESTSPLPTGNSAPPKSSEVTVTIGFPRTVTDARGKTLTLKAPPQRIVSLAPSNTELLFALGLGAKVVADTTACDYPPEAQSKPHVSGAGGQIDIEKVEVANPDLVVAVGSINGKAIDALEKANVPVLDVHPKTVAETYDAIQLLGKATGQDMQAEQMVAEMKAKLDAVTKQVASAKTKPKVLIAYGDNPIYTTGPGSFIDDVIKVAGGQNIVTAPLPTNILSSEAVLQSQPDIIICSKDLQASLKRLPGWATGVPAIRNNRFFTTSNASTLVRPSPRLAPAAEELAHFLHPELYASKPATP